MSALDWLLAASAVGFVACYFAVIGGAAMDIAAARQDLLPQRLDDGDSDGSKGQDDEHPD